MDAEVLKALPRNTEVIILSEDTEWAKIKAEDVEGYVAIRLLSDTPTETTSRSLMEERKLQSTKYYVSVSSANVRSEASTSSKVLATLTKKTEIEVVGEEGTFYQIKYKDAYAYMLKSLLVDSLDKIETVSSSTNSGNSSSINPPVNGSAQGIVDFAKQFLGYKYTYAGANPSSGFDCTGFSYYVYNQCGYSIGRTISSQLSAGSEVGRDHLQPGDLIFFNDSGNTSLGHVGIYIGDSKIVHSANPSRGVTTDTIASGYYNLRYVTARRYY